MTYAMTQVVLVALIGIYAIRSSWFLFSGVLSPLTPVALACMVLCIYLFHRPPAGVGPWLWVTMGLCVVGAIANGLLLSSTAPGYNNTTNLTFSAASVVLWLALAALLWRGASLAGRG